jgi:hypothetical protein
MNSKLKTIVILLCFSIMVYGATIVLAAGDDIPIGGDSLTVVQNERVNFTNRGNISHLAEAGNVTEINIFGLTQTKSWQGYYGEITGDIVLDDAQNWTMYLWPNPEPTGEIYAVNRSATPTWSDVHCFNYTADGATDLNISTIEESYNMTRSDYDGINETFNTTSHPLFSVGSYSIENNTCPATHLFSVDTRQHYHWSEVLLSDYDIPIFVAIIENKDIPNMTDPYGFDNRTHDFQLIVPEDGTSLDGSHTINENPTRYYFYVDLE